MIKKRSFKQPVKTFLKWPFFHLQFWRYRTISFPWKSLCLQITPEVSKIMESVLCDLTLTPNSFVKMRLVLEIKGVATIIHKIFEANSTFHVKWRPMGKVWFPFFKGFLLVLTRLRFWQGDWAPGYHSMGIWDFPDFS